MHIVEAGGIGLIAGLVAGGILARLYYQNAVARLHELEASVKQSIVGKL